MFKLKRLCTLFFSGFVLFLASCSKSDSTLPAPNPPQPPPPQPPPPPPPPVKPNLIFFGVNTAKQLIKYNANASNVPISTVAITGLQVAEVILGIDFRPATGELYALGSTSRLYIINTKNGKARAVGAAPFAPALNGSIAGFDFNPTVDKIRVVTTNGQNLRINPETGLVVATDAVISGVPGAKVHAIAYSGNTAGSSTTVLYDIDVTTQKLYKQINPNDGKLSVIGSLTVTATGEAGFDISPDGKVALAALTVAGKTGLYQMNVATGKATSLGTFASNVTAIAIPTNPVAYAVDIQNNLLIFNPTTSTAPISKPITGMQPAENILGIDFRPLNGQLYAFGSTKRLYKIDAATGAATVINIVPINIGGDDFGFDFNPATDRIRLVNNFAQNRRLNPVNAAITLDGILKPGVPVVTAVAYDNNFAGTATTTLYDIDVSVNKLYIQNPADNGTLVEVGPLGIDVQAATGFDIGSSSNIAYAILKVGAANGVYTINLATGAATKLNAFPKDVRGMTIGLGF